MSKIFIKDLHCLLYFDIMITFIRTMKKRSTCRFWLREKTVGESLCMKLCGRLLWSLHVSSALTICNRGVLCRK